MKLKFWTLFVILITLAACLYAQPHHTGLIFNDQRYSSVESLSPALKFNEPSVKFYSLKRYCPTPGDQGDMGSCVGWASGYSCLTIMSAINDNITSKQAINSRSRSALYIYNQIPHNSCLPGGSLIDDAVVLLKEKGDCGIREFNPADCNQMPTPQENSYAASHEIKDFYTLFGLSANGDYKINATINSLLSNRPVIIGLTLKNSFYNVKPDGLYSPSNNERTIGGHAICVIGFDNESQRFEVINSWGAGWGNNGFFTISYKDYAYYCKYAFQIALETSSSSSNLLSGTFNFKKFKLYDAASSKYKFQDINPTLAGDHYTFTNEIIRKDDFFRIVASGIKKNHYVYIFSLKPDNTTELIFPSSSNNKYDGATVKEIPIIPTNNASIEIPINEKKGISTDQAGNDLLCILYSRKKIGDIESIVRNIASASGDFKIRLQSALGNRLIPFSDIQYDPEKMSLSTSSKHGSIAPLILKINVRE